MYFGGHEINLVGHSLHSKLMENIENKYKEIYKISVSWLW